MNTPRITTDIHYQLASLTLMVNVNSKSNSDMNFYNVIRVSLNGIRFTFMLARYFFLLGKCFFVTVLLVSVTDGQAHTSMNDMFGKYCDFIPV